MVDPHHTIADVLEELLIPDPLAVAETIVRGLREAGFVIWPYEAPKPPHTP